MKKSKKLSPTMKVLIAFLAVVLIGAMYYMFLFVPTAERIAQAQEKSQKVSTELGLAKGRLENIHKMEDYNKELENMGDLTRMPAYNASSEETTFLHSAIQHTRKYSVAFTNITRYKDQIRRTFTLQFLADSYDDAINTIQRISNSERRCLVDDITYNVNSKGDMTVTLTATFFETMYDGQEDPDLPEDLANKKKNPQDVSNDDLMS